MSAQVVRLLPYAGKEARVRQLRIQRHQHNMARLRKAQEIRALEHEVSIHDNEWDRLTREIDLILYGRYA